MYLEMYNINDNSIKYRIANFLDDVFSLEEICTIIEDLNRIDIFSKRDIKQEKVEIYKNIFNKMGDSMTVYDVLELDRFPARRYLEVNIRKRFKRYKFKLKYDKNMYYNLIEIYCRTYNMIRYKSSNSDAAMTNNNILNNYAKSLAKILPDDKEILDHIRYISNNLFNDYKNMEYNDRYFKIFRLNEKVNIEISYKSKHIVKFQINVGGKRRLIYLNRSIIGIHNISVIVNKMYKYKKEMNKDNHRKV